MSGPRLVVFCWLAAIAFITWHWVKTAQQAPPANAFVGAATVYSIAGAVSAIPAASTFAGTLAIGWTLTLAYRVLASNTTAKAKVIPIQSKRKAATA